MTDSGDFLRRIDTHDVVERGAEIVVDFDGASLRAFAGETIAAVLIANGHRALRTSVRFGEPRGLMCGMGTCYECLVVVDGQPNVRACVTPARDGMRVATQHGPFAGVNPVPDWP
jgi:predicted molibdopterin-dependent oxidoreductase YjgC